MLSVGVYISKIECTTMIIEIFIISQSFLFFICRVDATNFNVLILFDIYIDIMH